MLRINILIRKKEKDYKISEDVVKKYFEHEELTDDVLKRVIYLGRIGNMTEEFTFKNYTEVLVDETIKDYWSQMDDVCKCRRCFFDTKALSLNNLPPKYIVSDDGQVDEKVESFKEHNQVEIAKEVAKAIMIVNSNYSHSLDEIVR